MNENWIAWSAGYFEGEGSIHLGKGRYPRIEISSTDSDVLAYLSIFLGCGNLNGPYGSGVNKNGIPNKQNYRLIISKRKDVEETALLLLPYLGERRTSKVKEVLSYIPQIVSHNYKAEPSIPWAAGLYEGEGSIFVNSGRYVYLTVYSTDKDVINKFSKIVNFGNLIGPYPRVGNRKSIYGLQLYGWDKVEYFTNKMYPYLGKRRREDIKKIIEQRPETTRKYQKS